MKKYDIEFCKKLAKKYDGTCLSDNYQRQLKKLIWQCKIGHIWTSSLYSVNVLNIWCNTCNKIKTLDEIKNIAILKGGECLSDKYINSQAKLLFKCRCGYKWETNANSIKQGRWCPECGKLKAGNKKFTINDVQNYVKKFGGECLSVKYKNVNDKLIFKCESGHIWQARFSTIQRSNWCPECNFRFKSENICREYFNKIFDEKFLKIRPSWLISNSNAKLELDGYCEALGIAFEHNGIQHYKPFVFSKKNNNLLKLQENDQIKRKLCEKHGVKLFIIPPLFDKIKLNDLYNIIKIQAEKFNLSIKNENELNIDLTKIFKNTYIDDCSEIANKKGGKVISEYCIMASEKIELECMFGHKWKATVSKIKSGRWCPDCAISKRGQYNKMSIDYMKELASRHGGRCLSENYKDTHSHLIWECSFKHVWKATPNNIKRGRWCPVCYNRLKNPTIISFGVEE